MLWYVIVCYGILVIIIFLSLSWSSSLPSYCIWVMFHVCNIFYGVDVWMWEISATTDGGYHTLRGAVAFCDFAMRNRAFSCEECGNTIWLWLTVRRGKSQVLRTVNQLFRLGPWLPWRTVSHNQRLHRKNIRSWGSSIHLKEIRCIITWGYHETRLWNSTGYRYGYGSIPMKIPF